MQDHTTQQNVTSDGIACLTIACLKKLSNTAYYVQLFLGNWISCFYLHGADYIYIIWCCWPKLKSNE